MLLNTDLHILKFEGAHLRAFKHPLHAAIVLSLLLHTVLLLCILSPRHAPTKPAWTVVEVHLNTTTLYQSDVGQGETPAVNVPPLPTNSSAIESQQEKTAVQSSIDTSVAPANNNPQATGMAIPQDLPIPSPGRRPLWSFQGPAMANAQAAYQAQVQRQIGATMQNQARMARGQYESYLKGALTTLPLQSQCRITLSTGSAPRVFCGNDRDAEQVRIVIDRFGTIPAIPGDSSPLEIEITPSAGKHSNILS